LRRTGAAQRLWIGLLGLRIELQVISVRKMGNSLTRARAYPKGLSWLAHAWALALLYKAAA